MNNFVKGIGLGILAGAAVGFALQPSKHNRRMIRTKAKDAVRAINHAVDSIM
ncbi:hypothetical protein LJC32_04750 [Oscillospiraceae bacterium OttesenSCG-928-F05]|nr:hypothetical protein [Oscillospiraceae bacterium OttesenSCG-928-F05]